MGFPLSVPHVAPLDSPIGEWDRRCRVCSKERQTIVHFEQKKKSWCYGMCVAVPFPRSGGWGGLQGLLRRLLVCPRKKGKREKKISTRRLCVPGVPFLVRKATRPTCVHLEKESTLEPAVGRLLSSGTQSIPAVPLSRARNRRLRPRGDISSLVNNSGGGRHLTQHC